MADTSLSAISDADLLASMLDQMKAFSEREQEVEFSDENLAALASDFLEWARQKETASLRLRPGIGANGSDLDVRALFHPILGTVRETRRSLIQIHLSPLTEAEQKDLTEEVEATLK
ncbi:MAG: hypothetical protein AAGK66_10550, partial [Pseudomonadota bacterium]